MAREPQALLLGFFAFAVALIGPATGARAAVCAGDCAGDGVITVDEIVTGVNIALGMISLAECPPFDVVADGVVTVDELILAVNSALEG